ncbi:MAG: iron uptake transporter permease EfeU, partial [Nakamurella sp.]
MLATFVIGLREGLEASLIVGIIAAFLKQSNRTDALRKVWLGVAAAVLLCLAVGVALQLFNSSLPQRQQEMLECVVAAIAVVMVSYMVLWMRKHSRDLKSDLQSAAGSALARGSAGALIAMAFLAVLREGFETAVFLLAAFQSALSPAEAAIGVILGIAVAVSLGYLIYRGGVKLNLSRFFRITGVVLVLVAAGLVMSTLRAAYEAGWLTVGQQTWLNLSAIARPGSVQESLLTGMLGIRANLPVVEVVAYLLYAIPMLLVVLWPPKRTPSRQALGRILVGTAAGALIAAMLIAALAPAAPASVTGAQGPLAVQGAAAGGIEPASGQPAAGSVVDGSATVTLSDNLGSASIDTAIAG